MQNSIRLKAVSQNGEVVYSNQLNYTKTSTANIFITDRVSNTETGVCTYKLHVEGEPFVGYANLIGQKLNLKNARVNDTFGGVLYIPNTTSPAVTTTISKAVNIPVGVYDCQIDAMGIKTTFAAESTLDGAISYGFGTDYYAPGIITTNRSSLNNSSRVMQVHILEISNGLKITETINGNSVERFVSSFGFPFIRSTNEAGKRIRF